MFADLLSVPFEVTLEVAGVQLTTRGRVVQRWECEGGMGNEL